MVQEYGQKTADEEDEEQEEEEEDMEETGEVSDRKHGEKKVKEEKPPPPTAPPELLKVTTGFVLVHQPPTQAFLQQLARLGIEFNHIVHFTSNPEDLKAAEDAGATQYACTDSEVIFEDEMEEPEIDANEMEREKEIDDALVLDTEVEPSGCGRPLADIQATCGL